ncbi:hypothetical protein EUGRSUZ_B00637 [Eucalyptus grandis]|uniref:Uncharacterized protein n=2 Tax=Eucalyptus grandis TaxID=71139 RepID=A0ACC3LMS5_EUCGR|nr:hypothetical protein EUGRSUZ_B00637 [Eucalyptus grandis]
MKDCHDSKKMIRKQPMKAVVLHKQNFDSSYKSSASICRKSEYNASKTIGKPMLVNRFSNMNRRKRGPHRPEKHRNTTRYRLGVCKIPGNHSEPAVLEGTDRFHGSTRESDWIGGLVPGWMDPCNKQVDLSFNFSEPVLSGRFPVLGWKPPARTMHTPSQFSFKPITLVPIRKEFDLIAKGSGTSVGCERVIFKVVADRDSLGLGRGQTRTHGRCREIEGELGVDALKSKKSPLDVVELVVIDLRYKHRSYYVFREFGRILAVFGDNQVRELENNPHFNAGKGSVLTSSGTVEMEACIMDGNMKCGAVSGLTTVVNAISLARLVMERTPHIYLAFDGAEAFAREHGVETLDASHFITPENIQRLKQAKEANRVQIDYTQPMQKKEEDTATADGDSQTGTVGCVAVDSDGNLAAATSTGGLVNKMVGRIGDTPLIGAGTYANSLCAVSATGKGEAIIRGTVARDVAALMEFKGLSLEEAAACVVKERVPKGNVGLVAVSATGEVTMPFNTTGMFRACATEDGYSEIAIWPLTKD